MTQPPTIEATGGKQGGFEAELSRLDAPEPAKEDNVHFCLLAEFDIDAGATLSHQYPYPTGTDEQ